MLGNRFYIGAASYFATVGVLGIYIPWILLDISGTAVSVGIMLCIRSLPGLLLSSFAGRCADKFDKRRLLSLACAIKMVALMLFVLFKIPLWSVQGFYLLIAFISVANTFFLASVKSYLHVMTDKDQLLVANGKFESFTQVGTIVGAGIGGLITAYADIEAAFFVVGAMLLFAGIQAFLLPAQPQSTATGSKANSNVENYSLFADKALIPYLLILLVPMLFVQMDNILLAAIAKVNIGLDASGFGFLNAAYSVGAMLIGIILVKKGFNNHKQWLLATGAFVALAHILLALSSDFITAMVACLFIGISVIWARINANSLIMSQVDSAHAGKLQAFLLKLHYSTIFVVGLVFGWLADLIGYDAVYLWVSTLILLLIGAHYCRSQLIKHRQKFVKES
jgi:DHA3 family macrolide efflux protein-like MFS transporter